MALRAAREYICPRSTNSYPPPRCRLRLFILRPHRILAFRLPPFHNATTSKQQQQQQHRLPRSLSSSACDIRAATASGPYNGWDDHDSGGSAPTPDNNVGWTDGLVTTTGDRNRRGRSRAPKDNDLGFGSERMVAQVARSRSVTQSAGGRSGRDDVENAGGGAAARRPRSLSLGAVRRYGDWARSSVQNLLRHDCWLGVRSSPTMGTATAANPAEPSTTPVEPATTPRRAANQDQENRSSRYTSSRFPGWFSFRKNYSRHPVQVTERRATPYAIEADLHHTANIRSHQQGVRTGGGNGDGDNAGRRTREPSTVARPFDAGSAVRPRNVVREASQADMAGAEGVIASNRGGGGGSGGQGYDRNYSSATTAATAAVAAAAKGVWGAAEEGAGAWDRTDNGMDHRGRGWSKTEHGGGELSLTRRWGEHYPSPSGQGRRRSAEGGTKGEGYSAGFRASKRMER